MKRLFAIVLGLVFLAVCGGLIVAGIIIIVFDDGGISTQLGSPTATSTLPAVEQIRSLTLATYSGQPNTSNLKAVSLPQKAKTYQFSLALLTKAG